jgi:lysophospholipase L1-like esterase
MGRHLARREPVRILTIGSSSTQGVGASSPAQAYPVQLERFLEGRWNTQDLTVDNAGIGGETAQQTVARLEEALRTSRPDLVIWQVGTNDAVKGGDEGVFRALLVRGLAAAEAAGVELILLDQQYYPGIKDPVRYERFVRIIRETADAHGVAVFSRYALMKGWADGAPQELGTMLSSDGFHMSDRGYACLTLSLGDLIARRVQLFVDAASARSGTGRPGR